MAFTGRATYSETAMSTEIAEDVSDLISLVSPYETPLLDHIGDAPRPAGSTYHEWLEDTLRASTDDAAIPPADQSGLSFFIRTYSAQIASVCSALGEKLRQASEVTALAATDFADSAQLRQVAAQATLADIFVARADNAQPTDANWIKAQHYRQLHRTLLLQLRLAVDADGNGLAEQTRSLGNVTLTRI